MEELGSVKIVRFLVCKNLCALGQCLALFSKPWYLIHGILLHLHSGACLESNDCLWSGLGEMICIEPLEAGYGRDPFTDLVRIRWKEKEDPFSGFSYT